jgi:large subunit ribosomal protein L4
MLIDVLNREGRKTADVEINDALSSGEVKEHLFYEVVKMQLANRRGGNACTKTKGEVSGGGVKPWKQKGTGRARSGSTRSPLWRHGGTVFGPRPRDYSYNVPKKVVKEALRSALRLKLKESRLRVFDSFEMDEPKTRTALDMFRKAGFASALVVIADADRTLELAARNLKDFKVIRAAGLNVYDVLDYEGLVLTRGAVEKVEALLK